MSLALTTWALLEDRLKSADRLSRYTGGENSSTHPNLNTAIAQASDMFRSAAINRYTEESVDALTSSTVPAEARFHIESLVLDVLTSSDERQPETIAKAADRAREWLRFLVGGTAHLDGLEPISVSVGSGSGNVRYRGPDRIFDRDSTSQPGFGYRNPGV